MVVERSFSLMFVMVCQKEFEDGMTRASESEGKEWAKEKKHEFGKK